MSHDAVLSADEIGERARVLIKMLGPNKAARELGVSRMTVLALGAGAPVLPATLILVRERLRAEAKR